MMKVISNQVNLTGEPGVSRTVPASPSHDGPNCFPTASAVQVLFDILDWTIFKEQWRGRGGGGGACSPV